NAKSLLSLYKVCFGGWYAKQLIMQDNIRQNGTRRSYLLFIVISNSKRKLLLSTNKNTKRFKQ
ncbi:MAG: hypothetical protein AAFR77_20355, partial [Cyanobacteria bacterium J06631_2]